MPQEKTKCGPMTEARFKDFTQILGRRKAKEKGMQGNSGTHHTVCYLTTRCTSLMPVHKLGAEEGKKKENIIKFIIAVYAQILFQGWECGSK
jgi:hypothetical protein